jgi:HEAT repeat protein
MMRLGSLLLGVVCLLGPQIFAGEVEDAIDAVLAARPGLPRSRAYNALRELVDGSHVPLLEQRIQATDDANAAYYLILVLRYLPGDQSTAALRRLLEHPTPYLASRAAWALWSRKDEGWLDGYLQTIADSRGDPERRAGLLGAFTSIRDVQVLDRVAALYEVIEEDQVRAALFRPLGYARDPRYLPLFRKGMVDPGEQTRAAAIRVLVASSDPVAIEALLRTIDEGKVSVDDLNQVLYAIRSTPALTPALTGLLLELLQRDLKTSCLTVLLPQIARTGDQGAAPRLHRYLETSTDTTVQVEALKALIALEPEADLLETLATVAEHESPRVRLAAAIGRMQLGQRAAVPDLAGFLDDESATVRREVAEAFQEHLARSALPHLIRALREEDESVRREIVKALTAHLNAFFPYRTPSLQALGLTETSPLAERKRIAAQLEAWFDRRTKPE